MNYAISTSLPANLGLMRCLNIVIRNSVWRAFLAIVIVPVYAASAFASPLELTINKVTQEFNWVDGTLITQLGDGGNRFGTQSGSDATITSPLALFSRPAAHDQTQFHISADGSVIEGIGLFTDFGPGPGSTFSGTPDVPTTAIFSLGDFSAFANLLPGSVNLAPLGTWDDGIRVNVVVPEPTAITLTVLGLFGFITRGRRRRVR